MLAPAQHRRGSGIAALRVAAAAGQALVASACRIVERGAAGALHNIAAGSRSITKLGRGAGKQSFGHSRQPSGDLWMVGKIAIAYQRTYAHAAIGQDIDPVEFGSRDMSTRCSGRQTPPFIRSRRLVPPARKAERPWAAAAIASPRLAGRM